MCALGFSPGIHLWRLWSKRMNQRDVCWRKEGSLNNCAQRLDMNNWECPEKNRKKLLLSWATQTSNSSAEADDDHSKCGICSWPRTHKLVCVARWSWCHGRFWNRLTNLYWRRDSWVVAAELIQKHFVCQFAAEYIQTNWEELHHAAI